MAADENIPKEYFAAWRKAFSSIQTNIHAQAGASGDWATDIAAFRAVGGGLPTPPPGYEILKSMVPGMALRR